MRKDARSLTLFPDYLGTTNACGPRCNLSPIRARDPGLPRRIKRLRPCCNLSPCAPPRRRRSSSSVVGTLGSPQHVLSLTAGRSLACDRHARQSDVAAECRYDVTIVERHSELGGRSRTWECEGFRFDMGPSWYQHFLPDGWADICLPCRRARELRPPPFRARRCRYWMPEVFDELFESIGRRRSDYYSLLRLDPAYRVFFARNAPSPM